MKPYDFDYAIEPTHFYAVIEYENGNQDYVHSPISFLGGWLLCKDRFKERLSKYRVDNINITSSQFIEEVFEKHPDESLIEEFIEFQIKQGQTASNLYARATARLYERDELDELMQSHGNYFRRSVTAEEVPRSCVFEHDDSVFYAFVNSTCNVVLSHNGKPTNYLALAIDPVKFSVMTSGEINNLSRRRGLKIEV